MPVQRDVSLLGSLSVESITQLLGTIIQLSTKLAESSKQKQNVAKCENCKEKGIQVDPNCNSEENNTIQSPLKNENESSQLSDNKESKTSQDDQSNICEDKENKVCEDEKCKPEEHKENHLCEYIEGLESYRNAIVGLLTAHSHVALHEKVFSSVVSKISEIYLNKKKTRPIIQDVVPLFLNSSLRSLDFGKSRMFAEAEMCQVLFDNLGNAFRLNTLDIGRSCYWRVNVFENLRSKLQSLPELTVLRIQYICTPDMISGLAENCPNLLELNLKGSEKITDGECTELAKCKSLKFLDITGTRVTGKGCWKIIDSLKSLLWLMHCAFNCNSDALLFESRAQLFDCIKEQVKRRNEPLDIMETSDLKNVFSLRNFWLFNPRSEDMLTVLLCPQLEHLRLDFIFQDLVEEPEVEIISQIPKINKLQVNFYDRCVVDLVSLMIDGCGLKLTTLDLHLADDYFFAAQVHNVVARSCPNLVTLRFSGDYKARHSLDDSDSCLDFEIESPAHPHLENLSITGVVSDCRLRFLLNHSPAVHNLHLDGELEWLHDEMFKSLLEANPLPNLEHVWFNVSTTVTLSTVRLLLLQDNSIHTIGRLCHMARSSMNEYQELQDLVREKNLNVKLIWVTDERSR